jgi:hypothetical protein
MHRYTADGATSQARIMPKLHIVCHTQARQKALINGISNIEHYFRMTRMGVCLLRRARCGDYHLLYYNCCVPYPASSQCSHDPCGVAVNDRGASQTISFLPRPSDQRVPAICTCQLGPLPFLISQAYSF